MLENTGNFETRDINLIAYLDLQGFEYNMYRRGHEAVAIFTKSSVDDAVQDFYNDKGMFQSFTNKLRNIKSRIKNTI